MFVREVKRGAPRITETVFLIDVLTIRPLLVTRLVLLVFDEPLLADFCVECVAVDNARRGNTSVFEVENLDATS